MVKNDTSFLLASDLVRSYCSFLECKRMDLHFVNIFPLILGISDNQLFAWWSSAYSKIVATVQHIHSTVAFISPTFTNYMSISLSSHKVRECCQNRETTGFYSLPIPLYYLSIKRDYLE